MKKVLLDTHTLIWLAAGVSVGPKARAVVRQADIVYVSALTALEIRIKHRSGKLPDGAAIIGSIREMGFTILDLTEDHTADYRIFTQSNKDPFDNALVSIAIREPMPFMTADRKILSIKHPRFRTIDARL